MNFKKLFVKDKSFWFDLNILIIAIIMILLMSYSVLGVEPTQQYNKLYLNPFYVPSMVQNTNYSYTVDINPPDGISNINSAILTLDAWINPTRTVFAYMNNIPCNTASYTISTTYASAGRGVFTFDCSNAVIPNVLNNVKFSVNGGNIGSSTAFIELVYMNNPKGVVDLHGTEYVSGDDGKMFLQFLDSEDMPVNNSECFLSVWYPNHSIFLNNTLMGYLSDGIYFKNFLVPSITGVYPASAKCYRPIKFNNVILYNQTGDTFESNSWIGGYNWSECPFGDPDCQNGWDYDALKTVLVTNATAGTGGCFRGNYCARVDGSYGFLERGFPETFIEGTVAYNITFKYKFLNFQTNELAEVYVFDGNWHLLEQIGLIGGRSNGVWYNASYYIEDDEFNMETLLLGFFAYTMPSSNDYFFVDDVFIHYTGTNITLSNESLYQVLRGSGEVHISNGYNNLVNLTNNISSQVWSYPVRNLTYYQNFSVSQQDLTNYSYIFDGVWNYSNRSLTYYENFSIPQVDLTNYSRIDDTIYAVNASLYQKIIDESDQILTTMINLWNLTNISISNIPLNVWTYITRNLTYYPSQVDLTNYSRISNLTVEDVWSYPVRNLTYYQNFSIPQQDLTNYSYIFDGVWVYPNRNLTYYPPQVDLTNYTLITDNVWNYVARYTHGVII